MGRLYPQSHPVGAQRDLATGVRAIERHMEVRVSRDDLRAGVPYEFRAPTEITAVRGPTAARNSAVDEVFDPWCGTTSSSARRSSPLVVSQCSAAPSVSAASRMRRSPIVTSTTSARSFSLASVWGSVTNASASSGTAGITGRSPGCGSPRRHATRLPRAPRAHRSRRPPPGRARRGWPRRAPDRCRAAPLTPARARG